MSNYIGLLLFYYLYGALSIDQNYAHAKPQSDIKKLVKHGQKLIFKKPDEHSSAFCSKFTDCETCLKNHTISNVNFSMSDCHYKVCYLSQENKNQFFSICYALDNEAACPANLTESRIITKEDKCLELMKEHIKETPAPANTNFTTATLVPSIPPNGTNTTISTLTPITVPHNSSNVTTPSTTPITTVTFHPTSPHNTTNSTTTSVSPGTHPTPAPHSGGGKATSKFSISSFMAGVFVTLGIGAVAFFATKYYRNNIRYRQF